MLNEILNRFELVLNTVVRIRRKENVILQNNAKMTFAPKMPTIGFYPKSENIG